MQTLESLSRQIKGAGELKSIVRTMKAVAAANIGQYKGAVASLDNYYAAIAMGILAYLNERKIDSLPAVERMTEKKDSSVCAIVVGSDQGFVGQFNDSLTDFVSQTLSNTPGKKEIWTVGTRIPVLLQDRKWEVVKNYPLPNSIGGITSLIGSILIDVEKAYDNEELNEFYIFHNKSKKDILYGPEVKGLLPFDEKWRQELTPYGWPANKIPEVIGRDKDTIKALIREYLFVTLFKACAESLASENYSRLSAMERAEKNIEELLDDANNAYHHLRQSSIDEELFDVVSGFEALKNGLEPDSVNW
jgi:F-type H+-transporting ATPase subunit gamma